VLHSDDTRYYRTASRCQRRVFRWIAPTPGVAERFGKYVSGPARRQRVRVIPHNVSTVFGPPPDRDDARAARASVFVGYVAENKGAHLLPDIMQRVADRAPGTQLTIVGDGPLRAWLESEFARRGLSGNVRFAGTLSPAGVADVMRAAGVLLLPTFIEAFGLVIAEAMTCGLAPVVSRLRGVTDWVVRHGETGVLVEPADVNGFADAVVHLAEHPHYLRTLGDAARAEALQRFSAPGMIEAYEGLFAEPDARRPNHECGTARWLTGVAWQFLKERVGRPGFTRPPTPV
jgi:glycosyltransferase involved in cell wall biosynthesis